MTKTKTWMWLAWAIALGAVLAVGEVIASAESAFGGQILVLTKRPPSYFNTKEGFVSFLRKNSTRVVYENEAKEWSFETMAFFKKPLGDYEVELVFYDIGNGRGSSGRRFVTSYTQYTQDRNTRTLNGKTSLIRPEFDANIRYQMVVQSHGQEVAKGEFETRGTSQSNMDQQKRYETVQKEMEVSIKDLERKVKEQEEQEKKKNKDAANGLF